MRVICVNNEGFIHLTLGKKYDAKNTIFTSFTSKKEIIYYYVIDDAGCEKYIFNKTFYDYGGIS